MCGRSSLHDAPVSVLESFGLPPIVRGFRPRYNIAPSQEQLTISLTATGFVEARHRRWGLVPPWAADESIGHRMVNARAETLTQKPSFRAPLRKQRCLIVADGYYEWRKEGGRKIPVFFHLSGHRPFTIAGLWERWRRGPQPLDTCVIITTAARGRAAEVHDRMPVIFPPEVAKRWIARESRAAEVMAMLSPYEDDDLELYDVAPAVNNPAYDMPDCISRT